MRGQEDSKAQASGGSKAAPCNSQSGGKGVHFHLLHGVAHVQYMDGASVGEHYEQAAAICPEMGSCQQAKLSPRGAKAMHITTQCQATIIMRGLRSR